MTPLLELPPGNVRDALNFECAILGGYSRIYGYERFDGRQLPSATVFASVYIDAFINIPNVGDTITGQTSAATGYVLAVGANYVVTSEVVGVFSAAEVIKVGATLIGNSINSTGGMTSLQRATYTGNAADKQRTHILQPPGSGPTRGVFVYNDLVYAFRNNAGGTAAALYVQSAGGWTLVPFLYELAFSAGTTAPAEGTTITQGGVTALVKRVALQSGVWAGSAAGRFIISAPAGGNFAAGAATDGASTFTLTGVQTAITFLPGGTFEFQIGNFSGQANTLRVYGVDGVNRCFEFDGTVLVPINTGFTPDTPAHVTIHKNFLFVGVMASLGFCAPGLPYDWTTQDGAGVVAVGDNLTNMLELPGAQTTATMGVWTHSNTYILYGTGASTWNLVPLNTGCGGLPFTAENMAHTYVMDDRGVTDMQETLNYGNFDVDTITYRVNNFVAQKSALTVCSNLNRHKSQYRIFFSDGYGLYVTNSHGQYSYQNISSGAMPVLFPDPVFCAVEAKLSNGAEVSYFGSANGYVYKLDSGSSFDGAAINAHITFGANSTGAPRMLKRYRHAQIEASGTSFFQYDLGYSLGFGSPNVLQPNYATYQNNISIPSWDNFTWDNFTWDGVSAAPSECYMSGTAENYAITVKSSSAIFYPFTMNSSIVHYTNRRAKR